MHKPGSPSRAHGFRRIFLIGLKCPLAGTNISAKHPVAFCWSYCLMKSAFERSLLLVALLLAVCFCTGPTTRYDTTGTALSVEAFLLARTGMAHRERLQSSCQGLPPACTALSGQALHSAHLFDGHNEWVAQPALILDLPLHVGLVVLDEIPTREQLDGHLHRGLRPQVKSLDHHAKGALPQLARLQAVKERRWGPL